MKKEKERIEANEDYDQLAQKIVFEYYSEGEIVNPSELARCFDIEVRAGAYENYFRGLIRYRDLKFKIYLNLEYLYDPFSKEARYTCSHELGHFFITSHRLELMKGNSLGYFSGHANFKSGINTFYEIELQAQSFAASLLMPKDWFINSCLRKDVTLKTLYEEFPKKFNTSFTSCIVRYLKLNLKKCIFIRSGKKFWQEQSTSFKEIYNGRVFFTYNPNRRRNIILSTTIKPGDYEYEVSYVNLSSWTTNIPAGSRSDLLMKEEIITTSNFLYCLLSLES